MITINAKCTNPPVITMTTAMDPATARPPSIRQSLQELDALINLADRMLVQAEEIRKREWSRIATIRILKEERQTTRDDRINAQAHRLAMLETSPCTP